MAVSSVCAVYESASRQSAALSASFTWLAAPWLQRTLNSQGGAAWRCCCCPHCLSFPPCTGDACVKWTDKWAERLLPGGAREQWGDKWREAFASGRGEKNGEVRGRGWWVVVGVLQAAPDCCQHHALLRVRLPACRCGAWARTAAATSAGGASSTSATSACAALATARQVRRVREGFS
jgi:hypothetical protein